MSFQGVPEQNQNPMLNHTVLERIFKLVEFDTKSFANYRLVCKRWHKESLKIWRKNAWLPVTTCHQHSGVHVKNFLPLLKSEEQSLVSVPFRKYITRYWSGAIYHYNGNPEQLEFWKIVDPLMTHLNINSTYFYSTENLRKVIFEFTPNLQSLTFGRNYYMGEKKVEKFDHEQKGFVVNENLTQLKMNFEEHTVFPLTWIEIICRFPNLESLEPINGDPRFVSRFVFDLLQKVELLRNTVGFHYFKKLSKLHLLILNEKRKSAFTLDLASLLKRLQFPLKILTLEVGSETKVEPVEEALTMLLESHAETLQELTLTKEVDLYQFPDFPFGINFLKLTKFSSTGKLIQNLKFLMHMPNLECLHLEQEEHEICLSDKGWSNYVHVNIKEFKITKRFCSQKQLLFLGKLMPNLTNVTIGLKKTTLFKTVCRLWKDVTDLNIYTRCGEEDVYWKSREGDKFIQTNMSNLMELRILKIGKCIEYSE